MKCQSASSTNPDAYDAGREMGERLAPLSPEAAILFAAIHYDAADLYAGLIDGIGRTIPVFGATSDGFVETADASDVGAAVLGLHASGDVRFTVAVAEGMGEDAVGTLRRCAQTLRTEAGPDLRYAFLTTALGADGALAAEVLAAELGVPFSGGIAGDDRKFERGWVLCNGKAHPDSVGLLGISGAATVSIGAASGWVPVGTSGPVDASEGTQVQRIGGESATRWVTRQLGREPAATDQGILSLMVQRPGGHVMRSIAGWNAVDGTLSAFGAVPKGSIVQLSTASRTTVLDAARQAVERAPKCSHQAAIVVSCAGRKWLLGDEFLAERDAVLGVVGKETPLIGFPSMGEFGPLTSALPSCEFHNVTCVVTLIGS